MLISICLSKLSSRMQTDDASANVFDSFLSARDNRSEINGEEAWQGVIRSFRTELPYDPKSFSSILQYLQTTLRIELELLNKQDLCAYCQRYFQRKFNFGRHQCAYHPYTKDGEYLCCGRTLGEPGCQRADHRAMRRPSNTIWTQEEHTVKIPTLLQRQLSIPETSIEKMVKNAEDPARDYLIVSRVGKREEEARY